MKRVIAICCLMGALMAAPAAWAANVAVLFANGVYQSYPFLQDSRAVLNLAQPLRQAGFQVIVVHGLDSQTIAEDMPAISRRLERADKIVIVTSGYVVRTSRDAWLMATDADKPDTFSIGRYGLSLGGLLDIAARKQGDVLIAIAEASNGIELGSGLANGYVPRGIPQGVTVVQGAPDQVADFIVNGALVPGRSMADAVAAIPAPFKAYGYVPRSASFLPVSMPGPSGNLIERSFWQRTRGLDTLAAYQEYLGRYPDGLFAAEARDRVAALTLSPRDRARIGEVALSLTGSQRRSIQNNLTILGFDTRGVDGVFGSRTRAAIAEWQTSIGLPGLGYLNANQISQLESTGARRAEELRLEAERRRLERERQDRQFWTATGADGSEAGLRTYLKNFPDGLYADSATEQLQQIERQKRRQAEAEELAAWNQAVMQGTLEAYSTYLQVYPNGRFVEEAQARVASLSNPETPPDIVDAAKQEEASLGLNAFRRQLIESQLRAVGLDPGSVDGKFDQKTRRALRQFQRANQLYVTGFVTRDTIVRLLVSSIDN